MFCRLARTYKGMSPTVMQQLYLAVAAPKALYAADIWFTPPHKKPGTKRKCGSVRICKRLESMQRLATLAITGALRSTATDVLNAHANIPPMELQAQRICHRGTLQLSTVPKEHPMHKMIHKIAKQGSVKHFNSQLHILFTLFPDAAPGQVEVIPSTGRCPWKSEPFSTSIAGNKTEAAEEDEQARRDGTLTIYTDGSKIDGGVGAAAVAFKNGKNIGELRY